MSHYFIKNKETGYVLDVEGASTEPGTAVIMWEKKAHDFSNSNQIWYDDHNSRAIRSALNDLCLTMNDDNELVLDYHNNRSGQRWERDGDKVRNCDDRQVLDIAGDNKDQGAKLCKWDDHDGPNQQFEFEYMEPRYFYIRSHMHGKVMDVSGANRDEGAEVIMWPQNDSQDDNQLWYEGPDGVIRSKLNDYTIDDRDGDLKLYRPQHGDSQGFRISGDYLMRPNDGKCIDISASNEDDGAKLCAWSSHGGDNQRWEIIYI